MSLSPQDVPEVPEAPEGAPRLENPAGPDAEVQKRRIPNLGHALLFVLFTGFLLITYEVILFALGKAPAAVVGGTIKVQHPVLQLAAMAGTYLATLSIAWLFYPLVWHRPFLDGLQWRWAAARKQIGQLIALGLVLGFMVQIVTYFITSPKTLPIDEFFLTPGTAWLITLFGIVVAPVFEEISFRGFLVPAFAIAYDWVSLPRTDEARTRWHTTTTLTPASLMFSAVLSSLLFAMLHAQQVAHLWAVLLVLFAVSLVLTYVRVKTQSVAASTIVHSAYNGFVFVTVLVATGGYRHLDRMTH
jgi:membrane protease YdiL (CAAX protease family)